MSWLILRVQVDEKAALIENNVTLMTKWGRENVVQLIKDRKLSCSRITTATLELRMTFLVQQWHQEALFQIVKSSQPLNAS